MENISDANRLHGLIIADTSLLKALVSVLPLEALQALLPELERDTEFVRGHMLGSAVSDATIETYETLAGQNIVFVRDQIQQKQLMQSPDGAIRWIKGLRPSDEH